MSELEIKQVPYKCDKCEHTGTVEAVIKRKPQKVIMEDSEDLSGIKKDLAELKAAREKPAPVEEKPKDKDVPSYLPKHFCKGKGCDGHDNPDAKRVTKKCRNCGQVAPENAGKCAFPGCREKDFEDLDDDELTLYNGENKEHDHE